jgi:hypothetical protein
MTRVLVLLLTVLFSSDVAFPQTKRFTLVAVWTDTPPVLDGIVDPEEWRNAAEAGDFIQFVPNRGMPASVETRVKILYDHEYIYFGFMCEDPEPDKIEYGTGRRDGLSSRTGTDSVTVDLDTFNDDRSSYYFRTNPRGVQFDGRGSDNGRVADNDWDGVWRSAGAMTAEGWSAEMAIPFRHIKYHPGKNQTWGIQFSRIYPRSLERSFWTGPLEDYRKISNNGALTGLDLEESKNRPQIIPHIISQSQQDEGTDVDVGLDVRHALTEAISGYLTLNPDFSTVEADQEQVNLTRFELNLPEKRHFFIEGNDAYKQDIRLFYSRRISDIYGGLKVYGKSGKSEISALSAQTKENIDEDEPTANFSVFRLRRDVLGSSNLGFVAANKLQDGKNQGSFGGDTTLYLTEKTSLTSQMAMSYADGAKSDLAFFVRPAYTSNTFHMDFGYVYLGDTFGDNANTVGYIPDDDRHELDSSIDKTFWMNRWNLDRIDYKSNYNVYWGVDKTLRSWEVLQSFRFDLRNKLSLDLRHFQEYKLYEKDFRNHSSTLELGYNTREWSSAALAYQFGKNFDSDFTLVTGWVQQNITRSLSLQYDLSRLTYSPDPEGESTWIHVFLANQFFTNDIYMKLFYQINTSIDKRNIQAVFVYRFQPPFGLLQVAYQKGTAEFGEVGTQGHTLFLKLAYVF